MINAERVKHLELIQGVVNRLATNSFLLKGWSVVLVSALFALAAKDTNVIFVYLAYFPAFAFWGLDGYFLRQERLFRALYDHVRQAGSERADFSMNTSIVASLVSSWPSTVFSGTLIAFHGILAFTTILVMWLLHLR